MSEIGTQRLLLRQMHSGDADALFAQFADWKVIRWLSMPPWPYTLDDARSFLEGLRNEHLTKTTFAITLNGDLIGGVDVRMNKPSHSQSGPGPNLGYWLGCRHWGHGYMTEAARAFLVHVFAAGLGDVVYSGAYTDNAASLHVQEKLGFVNDGETMLYARPRKDKFPHINTRLARADFAAKLR